MQTNAKVELSEPELREVPAQEGTEAVYPKFTVCDVYMHGIGSALEGPGKVRAHGTQNELMFALRGSGFSSTLTVLELFVLDPEKGFKTSVAVHSAYVTMISDSYELDAGEEMRALEAEREIAHTLGRPSAGPRVVGVDFGPEG